MEKNFMQDDLEDESIKQSYEELEKKIKKEKRLGISLGFTSGFLLGIVATFALVVVYYNILIGRISFSNNKNAVVNEIVDNSAKLDMARIQGKLEDLQKIVAEKFLFQSDIGKLETGIYKGYMAGLNDPYSVYYDADEFKALREETTGVYQGIGAQISKDATTGIIKVVKVFEGSPAKEAGLMPEDIIYKVNDIEATGMDLEILVKQHIRGEVHTKVNITVMRGDKEIPLEMERRAVEVQTVESKILDGNVGYIMVNQFDTVTAEQFIKVIDELQEKNISKLIIDLRNNPGGVLDGTVKMLDYMLPDGLLVYTADKEGKGEKYYSNDGHEVNIPISILINGNSASASEVFTGAMRDFKRATIVGTKSFGKGIVQNLYPLEDGSAIKITTQHYYTPSGFDLHGKGIEPDETVELNEGAVFGTDTDNQLQKAIDMAK